MTDQHPIASRADLAAALCRIQGQRILVIGDLMLDEFVDGTVARMSPEAPVPVLSQTRTRRMPGGAANVARNLAQLGLRACLLGVLGTDEAASQLQQAIRGLPAIDLQLRQTADRPTTTKTRYRNNNQQLLRVDTESLAPISADDQAALLALAEQEISQSALLILSDYAKGCLPPALTARLVQLARQHGKTILVDPKSKNFADYKGASILTPNLAELRAAGAADLSSDRALAEAARAMISQWQLDAMLVTMSERGIAYIDPENCEILPANAREVFDVSGAGDTVLAGLAAGMAAGMDRLDAVRLANLAAGIVVGKSGTSAVGPGEILAGFDNHDSPIDLAGQAGQLAEWRKAGLKIGFTNGCFDLLHPGHIQLLQQAASHADRLIVGLNSDASVKRLKGPDRPHQTARQRGNVLAALPFVDAVMVFDEDTPAELVGTVQPDCLIKGGDYQGQKIVGADIVRKKGGEIIILPLLDGYSTTSQIT